MEIVIVEGVSKKFSRNHHEAVRHGVRDMCLSFLGIKNSQKILRGNEFWAVNNVSFRLNKGETLGIIGVNGSGKTTLLKMISSIIRPDKGFVQCNGKVVPLFAKGAGFDPVLSGYENISINLSLLGLTSADIDEVRSDVIAFAELSDDVLKSPVKTYSSGMQARLGFACAVSSKPDILIVDEALAVGDMRFRTKCYRKLNELKKNGMAIILVSHSTGVMLSNCDRGLFLKKGEAFYEGDISSVIKKYEESLDSIEETKPVSIHEIHQTGLAIENVVIERANGQITTLLQTGEAATFRITFKTQKSFSHLSCTFLVKDLSRNLENVLDLTSLREQFVAAVTDGRHVFSVDMPVLNLAPGRYVLKTFISEENISNILDVVESIRFEVISDKKISASRFYQPHHWTISERGDG